MYNVYILEREREREGGRESFCKYFFFLSCSSLIPENCISDWGPVFAKDGGNVTKQPTKTKGFNTNNQ